MCGIVGYISKKVYDPKDIKLLMYDSELRGKSGCGYYREEKNKKMEDRIVKYSGRFRNTIYKENIPTSNLFMGHTRSPSSGVQSKGDTHPFFYNGDQFRLVGAHNGTLKNDQELLNKYPLAEDHKFDTDSKVLFGIMASYGFDVLSDIEGTASLLFTLGDGCLYLFRKNGERPLHLVENDDRVYIASDGDSLKFIEGEVKYVPTNTVLKIKKNLEKESISIKDNPKKPLSPVQSYGGAGIGCGIHGGVYGHGGHHKTTKVNDHHKNDQNKIGSTLKTYNTSSIRDRRLIKDDLNTEWTIITFSNEDNAVLKGHYPMSRLERVDSEQVHCFEGVIVDNKKIDIYVFENGSYIEKTTKVYDGQQVNESDPSYADYEHSDPGDLRDNFPLSHDPEEKDIKEGINELSSRAWLVWSRLSEAFQGNVIKDDLEEITGELYELAEDISDVQIKHCPQYSDEIE